MSASTRPSVAFSYSKLLLLALLLSLALLWLAQGCSTRAESDQVSTTRGAESMVILRARPERQAYLAWEKIEVMVEIENRGAEPVMVPDPEAATGEQPIYSLLRPGDTDPVHLSMGGGALAGPDGGPRIEIEAGGAHRALIALGSMIDLSRAGEYHLSATMEWQGMKIESEEQVFRVMELAASSIHLGLGTLPFGEGEGEGAFIQAGEGDRELYAFTFSEERPDLGETLAKSPIFRLTVGPEATDLLVPWRGSPFFNEMIRWLVWREGATLKALSSIQEAAFSFELPEEPAYLVRPALKTTGGPVEVLAVSMDQRELLLLRLSSAPGELEAKGELVWRTELPARPAGITAALAPDSAGGERHIAFVAQKEAGPELFHTSFRAGQPPVPFRSLRAGSGALLNDVSPALFVGADGQARVAVLTVEEGHCSLVEGRFGGPGHPAGTLDSKSLGVLSEGASDAALLYIEKEGEVARLELVISLAGSSLMRLRPAGDLVPVSVPGTPTSPILLAPGKSFGYILYSDPRTGLYFEPL